MSAATPTIPPTGLAEKSTTPRATSIAAWFGALLAVGLMLARIPYRGVRHDGTLYLGQAFAHLDPAWAKSELFFTGGFQDRYSLLSNVMAFALRHADVGTTCVALLLSAWAVNLWALHRLGHGMAPRARWLAVIAVVCVSHFYGASRMLGYFENFVTGRTWAEPLALVSLANFLAGQRAVAAVALVLAALMHPLIALPAGLVIYGLLVAEDRRWAWATMAVLPLVGLAFAGVSPFDGLLRRYDPAWFEATQLANSPVFIGQWGREDFVAAGVYLGVLWAANAGLATPLARACRVAAVAAIALCAASFVGADLLHDVLVTQLQLWRVLWLVNLLAVFTLPAWLGRLWAQGSSGRLAACAVLVAVVTAEAWISTSWALAAWAVLALLLHRRAVPLAPSISRLAMAATLAAGLLLCVVQALNAQGQMAMHLQGMTIARPLSIPFTLPLLTLPLAFGILWAWERGDTPRRAAALVACVGVLALAASQWDQRTPWTRYVESATRGAHPFDEWIPPGAQVYWHEDVAASWFLLGRPQYIGMGQLAGILFSRETAVVGMRRVPQLRDVMAGFEDCSTFERFGAVSSRVQSCALPRDAFFRMCAGPSDHADFLVASTDFGTGVVARWTFVPRDAPPVTYALYDCRRVAAALAGSRN